MKLLKNFRIILQKGKFKIFHLKCHRVLMKKKIKIWLMMGKFYKKSLKFLCKTTILTKKFLPKTKKL